MSTLRSRSATGEPKAANVALVMSWSLTNPVDMPRCSAMSSRVDTDSPLGPSPVVPFGTFVPVDHAVAPAAESVTAYSGSPGIVSRKPEYGNASIGWRSSRPYQ
jgi:hypothetical protein